MTGVIYMPQDQRMANVGNFIGGIISGYEDKKQMEQVKAAQDAIMRAPDRESAMEIFNNLPFKSIDQQQRAWQWFNQIKPPKDTTPKEVSTFDPQTGKETKQFVPMGELPRFSAAAQAAGQTLTKPDMQNFYQLNPDGSYKSIGRAPIENRPVGAVTMDELKLAEQQRTDALKQKAAERADQKFQTSLDRIAETGDRQQASKDISQLKAYNGVVASMLNVKKSIGQNGEIILDFGGNSQVADAYRNALEKGTDYMKKAGGDINKAAAMALRESGAFDKPAPTQPAAPTPQPQAGGLLSNFINRLRGGSQPQLAPAAPTPSAPKTVVRTGMLNGRKVVQYSDGTTDYAD